MPGQNQIKKVENGGQKVHERRREEYRKLHRDLRGRLHDVLAVLPDDIERHQKHIDACRDAQQTFQNVLETLEREPETDTIQDEQFSEFNAAMKDLENLRVEFKRAAVKLENTLQDNSEGGSGGGGKHPAFGIEIASLSFFQLLRLGFWFFMPFMLIMIFMLFVLSMAIIYSMRYV